MKKFVITLVLAGFASLAFAQKDPNDDGQELINQFFEVYKTKGYEAALKYAFTTNKWIAARGFEMNSIILHLGKEVSTMGNYIGHEEIRSRKVGSRFRIASYFLYYERDPLRIMFELYKGSQGWEISDVEFDTRFEDEIEESMKLSDVK